jgi:hypothetical protein
VTQHVSLSDTLERCSSPQSPVAPHHTEYNSAQSQRQTHRTRRVQVAEHARPTKSPMQRLIAIPCNASNEAKAQCAALAASIGAAGHELTGSDEDLLNLRKSQLPQVPSDTKSDADESEGLPVRAFLIESFADACLTSSDSSVRQKARDRLAGIIELAADTGASRVTLTPAVVRPGHAQSVTYAVALDRTVEALSRLTPHIETSGVRLCLHLSARGFLTSPPEAREVLDALVTPAIAVDLAIDPADRSDVCDWRDWFQTLERHLSVLAISTATEVWVPQVFRPGEDETRSSDLQRTLGEIESAVQKLDPAPTPVRELVIRSG